MPGLIAGMIAAAICILMAALSTLMILSGSVILRIVVIAAPLIVAAALPWARKTENIWVFLMVCGTALPINLYLAGKVFSWSQGICGWWLLSLIRGAGCSLILFSIEQLAYGVLTRWIWRRQIRIRLISKKNGYHPK